MAKRLFEAVVVESQLRGQAKAAVADLRNTFEKKRHLFGSKVVTFTPRAEGQATVTEEQSDIQSTVADELGWLTDLWAKALDTGYLVALGNTRASADVVLDDGTVLLSEVPATAIIDLLNRATEFQELLRAIPTLDPAKGFTPDPDKGPGIYRARLVRKDRTKKEQEAIVLLPSTKEHPGKAELISVDRPIGEIQEQEWSSLITPATKSVMLSRVEELRRALKQAQQRANMEDLGDAAPSVAAKVFGFVLKDLV